MKGGLWLSLLLSLFLLGCHGDPLQTEVYPEPLSVGGVLNSDALWQAEDGPYLIEETLEIPAGVTWTVEAGTQVLLGWNLAIQAQGSVRLLGTQENPIVVESTQGIWQGFRFSGTGPDSSTLRHVIVRNAVAAVECREGASPTIDHCQFLYVDSIGVRVDSGCSPRIGECVFTNDQILNLFGPTAIQVSPGGSASILRCQITGFLNGILFEGTGDAQLDSNTIVNCEFAIVWDSPDSVEIQGNDLDGNQTGVLIRNGSPYLIGNAFYKHFNSVRVEGSSTPTAHYNSFASTRRWAWLQLSTNDVDATENWWGTIIADSIAAVVYDQVDDPASGLVQYDPVLPGPKP